MIEILKTILFEWKDRVLPEVIERDVKLDINITDTLKKVVAITGFRRVGKTFLIFDLIQKLLTANNREEVVYINFEDERIPASIDFLTNLIPAIQEVFGKKPLYLFLDEIQNIPGWSKWTRRIIDTEDIKIIITGSSSRLGSYELPTELRGRSWEIKVYPLTFKEFLKFKCEQISFEELEYRDDIKARFDFLFEEYLLYGGLPEVVLISKSKKIELLQNYFQTVVRRDIVERFSIKNEIALKTAMKLLVNSPYMTISKLYNNLKSLGLSIGKTTLNEYITCIESSYFFTSLYYYSPSMKNQLQYPRKIYFQDNGFLTSLSTRFSKNYGRIFENLIFNELNKTNEELYYTQDKSGKEVDFVIMKEGNVKTLIQVCFDLSYEETSERETKSLLNAGKKFKCDDIQLITRNGIPEKSGRIKIISHYDFFYLSPPALFAFESVKV